MNMKRLSLITILSIWISLTYSQEYVTDNPSLLSTNCNFSRIAKVIVTNDETKVLIEVTGQPKKNSAFGFSSFTILLPYDDKMKASDLNDWRNDNLDFPPPPPYGASSYVYDVYKKVVEEQKVRQKEAYDEIGHLLIKDLGELKLNTLYDINKKKSEVYHFWLTFNRVPMGVEKIIIMELTRTGKEWIGIKIKNPDISPKSDWNEYSLKSYWNKNGLKPNEGIYENVIENDFSAKYKVALKYNSITEGYEMIYLSGADLETWKTGHIKAYLSKTASPNTYKVKWYMTDKSISENLYIAFEKGNMKILWTDGAPEQLYLKLYPTYQPDESSTVATNSSATGFAVSNEGYIATNYHVIQNAKKIKIKGIKGNFSVSYSAEVVVEDKNNDLAILKVNDENFTNLGIVPYKIINEISEVGNSVYTLGFPLRATMGDEVKLSNGIISSKTGFQNDITNYQISVPLQPGNSGGPLFDNSGNVIGVISAKHLGTENVSYAVKSNYLLYLTQSLNNKILLPKTNSISSKKLSEQVKYLKEFVYIIEVDY